MSDINAELRKLAGQGQTSRQIAAALGISQGRVLRKLKALGIKLDRPAWRAAKVRSLAAEGYSRAMIAATLGMSKCGVSFICTKNRIRTRGERHVRCGLQANPHAHPLVRDLIRMMNEQKATMRGLQKRAGLGKGVIAGWNHHSIPRVDCLIAAFNVLGYDLVIRPVKEDEDL